MKKVLLFSALALSFSMISCTSPLVGTWVQPQTSYTQEQGFVLYKDGTADDINVDFVKYESWEKKGDLLILKGKNIGSVKRDFSDTMKIEKVTDNELILSQSGYSVTFRRK
ncbi:MAG: hypothetical protein II817_00945 [Bacteroidales bacterium]|nr:hypothetical protein [Bacteroidales bacterium]MBQ3843528.1 hypothetical protein [Bacteroidales bacterium]